MQSVGITTDSSSCLPLELVKHFGIQVLPLQFVIGGRTYLDGGCPYRDWLSDHNLLGRRMTVIGTKNRLADHRQGASDVA
jgi:fatty acid-binding protein DegV